MARRARNWHFDEVVGEHVAISQRPRFQLKDLVALALTRKGLLLMDQKPPRMDECCYDWAEESRLTLRAWEEFVRAGEAPKGCLQQPID